MKRRLSAVLLMLCLVIGLMPASAFAAPEARRVNDTEFHIMYLDKIKKVVQNYNPGHEQNEIKIDKIFVHSGSDTVDGSGTNGYLEEHNAWKVQNTSIDHWGGISDNVTAITICAQIDKTGTKYQIPVAIDPGQLVHDLGGLNHITQILLDVKLTYDPNGGKESAVVQNFLEHDAVAVGNGVSFTRDKAVLLGFSETKKDLITSLDAQNAAGIIDANQTKRIDKDTTLYAVWAEDSNNNGKADYLEKDITVKFVAAGGEFAPGATTTLKLNPQSSQAFQVPEVTAPEGFDFDSWKWTSADQSITTSFKKGDYVSYNIILQRTQGTTSEVIFVAQYTELPPATKEITLNFYDEVNHKQVEEKVMEVAADATTINTSAITLPEGYEFTVTGDLTITPDGYVYVGVKPVAATKEITLNIYDIENHKQVKEEKMTVAADAIHVNTSAITLPEGYEFTVTGDLAIRDNNVYVEVKPVESGSTAIVNIRYMDGDKFVAGGDFMFEKDATVTFGELTLPEGYELDTALNNAESGFVAHDGAKIIVHIKKISDIVIMNIRFVEESTGTFISGGDFFVPAGVQNYSVLAKYVPEGYEMCVSGDFMTADGAKLEVPVKKINAPAPVYTISFDANGGSVKTATMQTGADGKLASLPDATRSNYRFDGWYTAKVGGDYVTTNTIFKANTTVYAHWTYKGHSGGGSSGGSSSSTTYPIIVEENRGGEVKSNRDRASSGTLVTITVDPDKGYEVVDLIVTDKDDDLVKVTDKGNGKFTFKMPASKVYVEAKFEAIDSPFADVDGDDYFYDSVCWAVEHDITSGTGANVFSPDSVVTRAQMVTFLWRAHGAPKTTGVNPFTDVNTGDYFYDAVLWAVKKGITNGTSADTFSPNAPVTRAQAVTFQWRAAGSPEADIASFDDVAADAYYAEAVAWAAENEITTGTGADTFSPDAPVTRAQAVTFLYRELA